MAGGLTVPHLNVSDVRSLIIPVPNLETQCEISRYLASCDEKIEVHERLKCAYQELFRTMLHQLMTAQIRVDDLDLSEIEGALEGS